MSKQKRAAFNTAKVNESKLEELGLPSEKVIFTIYLNLYDICMLIIFCDASGTCDFATMKCEKRCACP